MELSTTTEAMEAKLATVEDEVLGGATEIDFTHLIVSYGYTFEVGYKVDTGGHLPWVAVSLDGEDVVASAVQPGWAKTGVAEETLRAAERVVVEVGPEVPTPAEPPSPLRSTDSLLEDLLAEMKSVKGEVGSLHRAVGALAGAQIKAADELRKEVTDAVDDRLGEVLESLEVLRAGTMLEPPPAAAPTGPTHLTDLCTCLHSSGDHADGWSCAVEHCTCTRLEWWEPPWPTRRELTSAIWQTDVVFTAKERPLTWEYCQEEVRFRDDYLTLVRDGHPDVTIYPGTDGKYVVVDD